MDLKPLVTANRPKKALASCLQSQVAARAISSLSRHRIRNFDLTFDTRDPAVTARVEAQLFWRLYESAEIRLVRKYLQGCATIIDLGASLGFTGSHAIATMTPGGEFVAVEPNPALLDYLGRTLRSHAKKVRVHVICAAIAEAGSEPARLQIGQSNVDSRLGEEGHPVLATTLAHIVKSRGFRTFSLIADIEGAESSMIFADEALDRCDRMVVELHSTQHNGRSVSVPELCDRVLARGFQILEQQGPVFAFARRS